MFESISLSNLDRREEECEECLHHDILFDAILDGRSVRICGHCVKANDAIVFEKPKQIQIENSIRPSVRDVMRRASGIEPKSSPLEKPSSEVKLDDLRKRYEEIKAKRALEQEQKKVRETKPEEKKHIFLDEGEFVNYVKNMPGMPVIDIDKELSTEPEQEAGFTEIKSERKNIFKETFSRIGDRFKKKSKKKDDKDDNDLKPEQPSIPGELLNESNEKV